MKRVNAVLLAAAVMASLPGPSFAGDPAPAARSLEQTAVVQSARPAKDGANAGVSAPRPPASDRGQSARDRILRVLLLFGLHHSTTRR